MAKALRISEYMPTIQSKRTPKVQQTLKVLKNALSSIQAIISTPQSYTRNEFE